MNILMATSNPAKQQRLRWLLEDTCFQPLTLPPGMAEPSVEEDESSLVANATAKAVAWAQTVGQPALASDGGLCVPALGSHWNPARTRRAAGPFATDVQRGEHLLGLAKALAPKDRLVYHLEALALVNAEGEPLQTWQVRGSDRYLASTYDARGLPHGFWLPGALLFADQRWGDLTQPQQLALDDHWLALRDQFRAEAPSLLR